MDSQFGQHFPVEHDVMAREVVHELLVRDVVLARADLDPSLPDLSHISLLVHSSPLLFLERLVNGSDS